MTTSKKGGLRQLIVFAVVGGTATVCYAVGTWLLGTVFAWSPVAASVTSYAVCAAGSYLLHSIATFQVGAGASRDIFRFIVTTVLGFLISAGVMKVTELLNLPLLVGIIIVSVTIPLTNFLALKYWVFSRR